MIFSLLNPAVAGLSIGKSNLANFVLHTLDGDKQNQKLYRFITQKVKRNSKLT